MQKLEERVESLESLLGQFIVHSDVSLRRLENEIKAFKDGVEKFKEGMEKFKDEMEKFKEGMENFKDGMEKFKDEMKEFKDRVDNFIQQQKEENRERNKQWSNLAKKMGTIVEDLIAPALRPVLSKYFNCEVNMEGQRLFKRKNGEDYEIDAIAACDEKVFMIEVRSTPKIDDVKEIKEKSERFFEFFPEHKNKKLIVIFGSITFPENVIKYATRQNIYILAWRQWEYMDILNFDEIKKKTCKKQNLL